MRPGGVASLAFMPTDKKGTTVKIDFPEDFKLEEFTSKSGKTIDRGQAKVNGAPAFISSYDLAKLGTEIGTGMEVFISREKDAQFNNVKLINKGTPHTTIEWS